MKRPEDIYILVGCEESQEVTKTFRARGFQAFSCDLQECSGGHPEWHIQGGVIQAIRGGYIELENKEVLSVSKWHAGIFFPDCTFLTCSAEWAYSDGPYHQKTKPGTLVGSERREARKRATQFFMMLYNSGIPNVGMENPVGVISSLFKKPDQVIQPYQFNEDASKGTCIWIKSFPVLKHTGYFPPRIVEYPKGSGKMVNRWSNQTDGGQNKISPDKEGEKGKRAKLRSKTYTGIAKAMAEQWGSFLLK